ncbi:MAG: flagellar export chaperone FlgN [Planctomycetota bacterium]
MIKHEHIDSLERILQELLTLHEQLVSLAGRHRQALRRADGPAITAISLERDGVNERIMHLNDSRLTLTTQIAESLGTRATEVTVRSVIAALEPRRAASLVTLADALKGAIEATRREHSVLRDATAAFAGQLGGVLNRAVEMCAPARTYTAAGRVALASTLPSALDVRH